MGPCVKPHARMEENCQEDLQIRAVMPTNPRNRLGDLERAVMEHLWSCTPSHPDGQTGREIHDVIVVERGTGYTTLMTVLNQMVGKELLTRVRDGRVGRYTATATREALTSQTLHHTLGELAAAHRRSALLHFLESSTPGEVDDLRAALTDLETRQAGHEIHPADRD